MLGGGERAGGMNSVKEQCAIEQGLAGPEANRDVLRV